MLQHLRCGDSWLDCLLDLLQAWLATVKVSSSRYCLVVDEIFHQDVSENTGFSTLKPDLIEKKNVHFNVLTKNAFF